MTQHNNNFVKWKGIVALLTVFVGCLSCASATTHNVEARIGAVVVSPQQGEELHSIRVFSSDDATQAPLSVAVLIGDTVLLSIENTLSTVARYEIQNQQLDIAPSEIITVEVTSSAPMVHVLHSQDMSAEGRYVSAFATVAFVPTGQQTRTWILREYQSDLHTPTSISAPEASDFEPDFFTINGKTKQQLISDSSSIVSGKVGDTLHIVVANAGLAMHSMHFHGYHVTSIAVSNAETLGWSKDTWPLRSGEWALLQLVPDKPGKYPVHDHNLVAVSGGGQYPNGMFTIMEIQP